MKYIYSIFILALFFGCANSTKTTTTAKEGTDSSSKKTGDGVYSIAFYNVENLFNTTHDEGKKDEEYLPTSEKQWDKEKYEQKQKNLAKVISQLGDADGPEILGLCEVENLEVLEDLIKQKALKSEKYGIVHFESGDYRGIDNALIYKKKAFQVTNSRVFKIDFPGGGYTSRDILLVSGLMGGDEIHFLVNHFPSRRGGQAKSEPKRVLVATKLREVVESLMKVNPNAKIVIMGDFNDETTDKSIQQVLMAKGKNFDASKGELYNAMANLDNEGHGSYNYKDNWQMLDQIIMSPNMFEAKSGWDYIYKSSAVYSEDYLRQTEPAKYRGYPNRTFAGRKYLGGYSDHFPVYIKIEKK
jgi:predicted extracellular nuclease